MSKNVLKSVMYMQSCCFAEKPLFFDVVGVVVEAPY